MSRIPAAPPTRRPRLLVIRHGDTAWTRTGQHTGRTDLALEPAGEAQAAAWAPLLAGRSFVQVLTSPLTRARRTCELAGFGSQAKTCSDLQEWDYGAYEGRTTADIHRERPDWDLWRDGVPHGEGPGDVARRADRVIERVLAEVGDTLVFGHGHQLRVLCARWLGQPPGEGRHYLLGAGALGVLGWEHDWPAIEAWNLQPPAPVPAP